MGADTDLLTKAAEWGFPADIALRMHTENFIKARAKPIPAGSMRVAPGSDAVVWRIHPDHGGEL